MKILKHPDSTKEQIMEVRRVMLVVEESLHRVIPALRVKYPYRGFSDAPRPWHKPEYDRYDQAIMGTTRAHDRTGRATETIFEEE